MSSNDIISKFIAGGAYTNINHSVLLGLGGDLTETFLLQKLITSYDYFRGIGELNSSGWFFQTIEDIETKCAISECRQRRAFRSLEEKGLISMRLMGVPPRRHFKVFADRVLALVECVPIPTPITPKKDKAEFYEGINRAFKRKDWKEAQNYIGSIKKEIGYFMYVWTNWYWFDWNPKDYGQLRNYLIRRYENKPFDWSRLWSFREEWTLKHARTGRPSPTIYDFTSYDRLLPERAFSEQMSYGTMMNKGLENG